MRTPVLRSMAVVCMVILGCTSVAADDRPPNIVLILADDLGWTDLACYGSDLHETPAIDQLAREGMKFTQAYSACTVCSPTRASILTGKYPARLHVTDWIPGLIPANPKLLPPEWTKYLPLEETTLAEIAQNAGYQTASIGKWHLGDEQFFPEKQGFELNVAGTFLAAPRSYFAPYEIPTIEEGPEGEYLTDRLSHEAAQFIERAKDKPFFLYLPHFAVHLPLQAKPELIEKYQAKVRPELVHKNAQYAAMLHSLDEAVGRVLTKLRELDLGDETIVIFTSDNGGRIPTTSNSPLRYGKASCYEGGTRVPLIISWPGITEPGSTSDVPVISPDLFPTVLDMIGGTERPRVDGMSLTPILKNQGAIDRDTLFWHYPHYQLYQQGGTTPYGAVRQGDWKLIEFYDDMQVELYNVREDISEKNNLASTMPEKVQELRKRLEQWREEVGAQMPTRNASYDPAKPEHIPKPSTKKTKAQRK